MATEISNELKRILVNQETIVKWVSKKLRKQGHHSPPLIQSIDTISTRHFDMPDKLREQLMELNPLCIEEVEVMPLLPRNLCHHNSQLLLEVLNAKEEIYEQVVGYNITGCNCVKFWSMELHSVIRSKKTGEIFDLTTDFEGLTKKWFIGMKVVESKDALPIIRFIVRNGMDWFYSMHKHKCGVVHYERNEGQEDFGAFKNFWKYIGRARFIIA